MTRLQSNLNISYIDQLGDGCDERFQRFASLASAAADDATLLAIFDSFASANHTVGAYKVVLQAKLERFRAAVKNIGRRRVNDETVPQFEKYRDTRVVWVRHVNGKRLWYQAQDSEFDPTTIKKGDPGFAEVTGDTSPTSFGARGGSSRLVDPVPDEFVEEALAISEQRWGATPTIEDPASDFMAKQQPVGSQSSPQQQLPSVVLSRNPPTAPLVWNALPQVPSNGDDS